MTRANHKIRLFDGTLFDPIHCRPEDISIVNIAHGLSNEARFSGQGPGGLYTVAQHSVMVSYNCDPGDELAGLLHDSEEGLGLRDIATPIKSNWWMWFYRRQGDGLRRKVFKQFEIDPKIPASVHIADKEMMDLERAMLWTKYDAPFNWESYRTPHGGIYHPKELLVWSPAQAEHEFLLRFAELTKHHRAAINGGYFIEKKWFIKRRVASELAFPNRPSGPTKEVKFV